MIATSFDSCDWQITPIKYALYTPQQTYISTSVIFKLEIYEAELFFYKRSQAEGDIGMGFLKCV